MSELIREEARDIPVFDKADVPVRDIQRELLRQGVRLGDDTRLAELGLSPKAD